MHNGYCYFQCFCIYCFTLIGTVLFWLIYTCIYIYIVIEKTFVWWGHNIASRRHIATPNSSTVRPGCTVVLLEEGREEWEKNTGCSASGEEKEEKKEEKEVKKKGKGKRKDEWKTEKGRRKRLQTSPDQRNACWPSLVGGPAGSIQSRKRYPLFGWGIATSFQLPTYFASRALVAQIWMTGDWVRWLLD